MLPTNETNINNIPIEKVKEVPFDLIEPRLAFAIPYEWCPFLHELGEGLDAPREVGEETLDVCQLSLQRPQVFELLWRWHVHDGPDLIGLDLDASLPDHEPEEDA